MALTRAAVEAVLLRRVGSLLEEVGLDGSTVNNSDLNDPIGYAVRQVGGTVADASAAAGSRRLAR